MSATIFQSKKHVIETQYVRERLHATINGDEDVLKLAINQYSPLDNLTPGVGDLTIIAAHANGVGKELYEPVWDDLYTTAKQAGFRIRSIWIADVAWQGESGVLNEHKLGNDPHWLDHSRDLLHMVNHFRRDMGGPLIGIGHSMGGAQITNLALIHPRLFHSVILIDPIIQAAVGPDPGFSPAKASTFRRDLWPSRDAARKVFRSNKFYQQWDPRVFDLWIEHGLRELPTALYPDMPQVVNLPFSTQQASADTTPVDQPESTKQVTLTTTRHQEVFTFKRPMHPTAHQPLNSFTPTRLTHPDVSTYGPAETISYSPEAAAVFAQLPLLRPRCFYVFGETSAASSRQLEADKLRITGIGIGGSGGDGDGAVQSVLVKGAGHFVPFERPQEVAEAVAKWIASDVKLWQKERALLREKWDQVEGRAKFTLSEDWKWWMQQGQDSNRPRGSSKL